MLHMNKQQSSHYWRMWNQLERVAKAPTRDILFYLHGIATGSAIERTRDQEALELYLSLLDRVADARRKQLEAGQ